ncbi:YciI family protein [Virgibacillus sp. W0181]|uniref:YciI family protein n=1 Tax=Virgibacillus sp. W0181 TaxID=3391581 RepID=UPI003F460091
MKYFAAFLALKDEEKSRKYRPEHLDFLAKMRAEKKVFMNGRFTDGSGGLVIYSGESYAQVEKWVQEDPYIIHGARDYTLREWDMMTDIEFEQG